MPFLMPFIDLPLCSKPVRQIIPVLASTVLPEFVGALSDLLPKAQVFVHLKNRHGGFVGCSVFHGVDSSQKAKQSQPNPKNPAWRLRAASMPARS